MRFRDFATKPSLRSNWTQNTFYRAFKKLSTDVIKNEIRQKTTAEFLKITRSLPRFLNNYKSGNPAVSCRGVNYVFSNSCSSRVNSRREIQASLFPWPIELTRLAPNYSNAEAKPTTKSISPLLHFNFNFFSNG